MSNNCFSIKFSFLLICLILTHVTVSPKIRSKGLFIWEAGRAVCRDGKKWDLAMHVLACAWVKWDLAMHVLYISVLFVVPSRYVFRPVPAKRDPGSLNQDTGSKAGQFLSNKHSASLCRGSIMLTVQIVPGDIVPGEIVPGRNILM